MDRTFERTLLLSWRRAIRGVLKVMDVRLQWHKQRRLTTNTSKRTYEERSLIAWRRGLRGIVKTIEDRLDHIDKTGSRGT